MSVHFSNPFARKASIPFTETSHPNNPIPEEPGRVRQYSVQPSALGESPQPSDRSNSTYSDASSDDAPSTPDTDAFDDVIDDLGQQKTAGLKPEVGVSRRRASTVLVSQNSEDMKRLLGDGATEMLQTACCGGGCCKMQKSGDKETILIQEPVVEPENKAYQSLELKLGPLGHESKLEGIVDLPEKIVSLSKLPPNAEIPTTDTKKTPPSFVTPHPPYEVFSAPLFHARELTKPGAEKRTYHFDIDVTDYPAESGDVDFVVGGAIGVCAPNSPEVVNEIFDLLGVPGFVRDQKSLLKTSNGRWPTIWGDEQARELVTTRRDILTWCTDVQSYPPTKLLLRVLAEYATAEDEKKILTYLSSNQGQAAFCDLRTGPYVTLSQLLNAFPSSRPPIDHLLSVLNALMPRFYSLSQDPQISGDRPDDRRRLVEIAVTVHEAPDWQRGVRTGTGSGFLERTARKVIEAEKAGIDPKTLDLRIPMFRGLMANPLAREFVSDGPMLLIGAGVGVAPFRGFVQRRLKSANCANKVWVLQGVRDSLLDELYSGEWGVEEEKVKKVVQSRKKGEAAGSKYVQDEVRQQADLVWFIINALDGRVFVCGSSKGMGEGVEAALVDVAMAKGNLNEEEAQTFWAGKKDGGQYIAETW